MMKSHEDLPTSKNEWLHYYLPTHFLTFVQELPAKYANDLSGHSCIYRKKVSICKFESVRGGLEAARGSVSGENSLFDQAQGNDVVDKADKSREVASLEQPEERGVAHQRFCELPDVLRA